MVVPNKKILVVAAHPDDEMLGCGGTLARLKAQQCDVSIVLLGEGPTSRGEGQDPAVVRGHADSSAMQAAKSLGITDVRHLSLPDNKFDSVPLLDIVQKIEKVKAEIEPDLILTHHAGDMNIDHRITHQAVMTAFRPLPGEKASILGFEVLSSTEYAPNNSLPAFLPNVFVNITGYLPEKLAALEAYQSEMRQWPHPRSFQGVEHLAHLRGCQCGCDAAEAFVLLRAVL